MIAIQFLLISACVFVFHFLVATNLASNMSSIPLSLIIASSYFAFAICILFSRFVFKRAHQYRDRLALIVLFSICLSILLIHHDTKNFLQSYAELDPSLDAASRFRFYLDLSETHGFKISFLLSLPFFCYGIWMSSLIRRKKLTFVFLRLELAGMAIGILTSLVFLDFFGWFSAILPFLTLALIVTAIKLFRTRMLYLGILSALLLVFIWIYNTNFEPPTDTHLETRVSGQKYNFQVQNESWNAYSRVQTLRITGPEERTIIRLDASRGTIQVPNLENPLSLFTVDLVDLFKPKTALILFAGAGQELILLSQKENAPEKIVGVELNQDVVEHGRIVSNGLLDKIVESSNVKMVIADGRTFLESDTGYYDNILFSWSGATARYLAGAMTNTTQYVFTREAIAKALERLTPKGHLLILGESKFSLLTHLRALGLKDLEERVMILKLIEKNVDLGAVDPNMLIIAKEKLDKNFVSSKQFSEILKKYKYELALAPGFETSPGFAIYEQIIKAKDWSGELDKWNKENNLNFFSRTDDSPFVYRIESIWNQLQKTSYSGFLKFIILITVFTLITMIVFMCLRFKSKSKNPAMPLAGFISGVTFQTIQFILIYKILLFVGNPGYALSLSLIASAASSFYCLWFVGKRKHGHLTLLLISMLGLLLINFVTPLFESPGAQSLFFALLLPVVVLAYPLCIKFERGDSFTVVAFDVLGCCWAAIAIPLLIADFGITRVLLFVSVLAFLTYSYLFVSMRNRPRIQ